MARGGIGGASGNRMNSRGSAAGHAVSGGGRTQSSGAKSKPKPKPKPKPSAKTLTPAQKAAQKKTAQSRAKKTAQKADRSFSSPPATTVNWTKPRPSTDPMRNKNAPKKTNDQLFNEYYKGYRQAPKRG